MLWRKKSVKIILLADNSKNELLVNFCTAYSQILNRHESFSVTNIALLISEATHLNITGIQSDIFGSFSHFASKVRFNEIDAVIYLRDPFSPEYEIPNSLIRECDTNQIPCATNIASAEILILAIDRGDLDWRDLLR
jgi:methylglyoxal synthase